MNGKALDIHKGRVHAIKIKKGKLSRSDSVKSTISVDSVKSPPPKKKQEN